MSLCSAVDIRRNIGNLIRPAEQITVSTAAERYVKVRGANGNIDSWNPDLTPYMVEPMNILTSRKYEAGIFIGPAQSGKTQGIVTCGSAYVIKCDPSDFMIMQTSKDTARDFDMQVIKRAFRDSPVLKQELAAGKKSDNTFDKVFKSGNILFQAWPSINKLSGKPLKYVFLTDYDRMSQNIDKEGSPFSLAQKRTIKFLSSGMTMVETSPGFPVMDPSWTPRFAHEAPPCDGGLALYNMGDMRRWYVKCPVCGEYYMPPPDQKGLVFAHNRDIFDVTDPHLTSDVHYLCMINGCKIDLKQKRNLNNTGVWLPQGCSVKDGQVIGECVQSKIASWWFPGILAAYSNPHSLAIAYLNGCREYEITGSEQNLKTCINTGFGSCYLSRRIISSINADDYKKRSEDIGKRVVYLGVRFLVASIDVQSWGFEVQVVGYGLNNERWVIDRFAIRISNRLERGDPVPAEPSAYSEDWDLITEKVIMAQYPLDDDSGRSMCILTTICDSLGKKGVTGRAYEYWRKLRRSGLDKRFKLLQGKRPKPLVKMPRVKRIFPDNSNRTDRRANARGEVPVWSINTTQLKDTIHNDLSRIHPGAGFIHFPDWLPNSFYAELTAETRDANGWNNLLNKRNESWDLFCYADAAILAKLAELKMIQINWDKPPAWAEEWATNSLVSLENSSIKIIQDKLPVSKNINSAKNSWLTHSGDWM